MQKCITRNKTIGIGLGSCLLHTDCIVLDCQSCEHQVASTRYSSNKHCTGEQTGQGLYMDGAAIGITNGRSEYLERLRSLLTAGAIKPLMRIDEIKDDSMIPPHLNEDLYATELLLYMRLHNREDIIWNDDSIFERYKTLEDLRGAKPKSESPDYMDMSKAQTVCRRACSHSPQPVDWSSTHNSSTSSTDSTQSIGGRLKRTISKKFRSARKRFRRLNRSISSCHCDRKISVDKAMQISDTSLDLTCHESMCNVSIDTHAGEGSITHETESLADKLSSVSLFSVEQTPPTLITNQTDGECLTSTVLMIQSNQIEDEEEEVTVLETNVYRLHDNVVDLDEGISKLLKVEDERALSPWTNVDKRWSLIQNENQAQVTPSDSTAPHN